MYISATLQRTVTPISPYGEVYLCNNDAKAKQVSKNFTQFNPA